MPDSDNRLKQADVGTPPMDTATARESPYRCGRPVGEGQVRLPRLIDAKTA